MRNVFILMLLLLGVACNNSKKDETKPVFVTDTMATQKSLDSFTTGETDTIFWRMTKPDGSDTTVSIIVSKPTNDSIFTKQ